MSEEQNMILSRRVIEDIVSQGNYDLIPELMSPDYILHSPGGQEVKGSEAWKQLIQMYHTAFPDINMKIEDIFSTGDKVTVRFIISGTHRGDLMGISPTEKYFEVSGIIIGRVANGKAVEAWEMVDQLSMFQQLGLIPPLG